MARSENSAEKILNIASDLFYREGIRAVGVDRIILETGIAKATLYRHFAGKDDLVAAYLQRRHERVMAAMQATIASKAGARKKIMAIFDDLQAKADAPDFRGCAFSLAVAEYGGDKRVVEIARQHKQALADLLHEILMTVAAPRAEARLVAAQLAVLYEGALSLMAISGSDLAARTARDAALVLFDTTHNLFDGVTQPAPA